MTALNAHRASRFTWSQPFVDPIALVVVAVTVAPVIYVILNGFRTTAQINADPGGLPDPWVFEKYLAVFQNPNFWDSDSSTHMITPGATTAGVVVVGVMAAFVIARYEFWGRTLLYSLLTAGLLFPLTVAGPSSRCCAPSGFSATCRR